MRTIIAQQLPGRTENDVKSLWNTKLKKKLSAMGIDPVTHKPFSQILADSELQAIKSITESTNYSSSAPDAINIVSCHPRRQNTMMFWVKSGAQDPTSY
nr:transcription factor MYB35-like [Ipomoea batatas]GME02176.1 transcription factor MYB35-like [Ipomoea batatas]